MGWAHAAGHAYISCILYGIQAAMQGARWPCGSRRRQIQGAPSDCVLCRAVPRCALLAACVQPLVGCKAGACLLFKAFYSIIDYDAGGRALPGTLLPMRPLRCVPRAVRGAGLRSCPPQAAPADCPGRHAARPMRAPTLAPPGWLYWCCRPAGGRGAGQGQPLARPEPQSAHPARRGAGRHV